MAVPPTRRQILGTATLAVLPAAPGVTNPQAPAASPASPAPSLPPRRLFFADPDRSCVRLSPDGLHLAWREPRDGVLNIVVAPADDPAQSRQITHATARSIPANFLWAWTNQHIVYFASDGDENDRAVSIDIDSGTALPLTPPGVRAFLQQTSQQFPGELLIALNARDHGLFDLVRVDVTTGDSKPVFQNPGYDELYTASDFAVHFASRVLDDGSSEILQWQPDGTWTIFAAIPAEDVLTTSFGEISADLRSLFVFDSRGRNTTGFFELDVVSGERRLLAEDAEADIIAAIYDPVTRRPHAAASVAARLRWHLIEPSFAFDLSHLQLAAAGGDADVDSLSAERGRIVARLSRSDAVGAFLLYDRNRRSVTKLFKASAGLDALALRPMQPVTIPASDGTPLPGYLTLPSDGAKAVPLVLVVHGGPYDRDVWGFRADHQWLASRGYAVLSVNFRGSTGFGKKFVNLADQGWGGRMQDDLTDAVAWAVGQGHADAKRIGCIGGSYGGYAALMAAVKTPETFACIVDQCGPSSLLTMIENFPPYWATGLAIWKRRLADPATEEGRRWLAERSPLGRADRIVRPLLIFQGLRDVLVTPRESAQLVQALQLRKIPVSYVTFADEGHGLARQENNIAYAAVVEAFLAKHLGGQSEPLGTAFAGSSISFEVGRELIPGIG
jgi:dipeptidyl aminopeptidase/acylaminoacyl peptidase